MSDSISYSSYNARFLTPMQVAQSFIPSQNFEKLLLEDHCQIIGPRGSGKTSLLKMLLPDAIDNWKHHRAEHYREKINFSSVFIPTDIVWKHQLESICSIFEPLIRDSLTETLIAFSEPVWIKNQ